MILRWMVLCFSDSMSLMPRLRWNWEKQLCLAETEQCFFHPMRFFNPVNSVFWPWTSLLLLRWQHRCRECETSPRCLEWRLPFSRGECLKVWRLQRFVECIFIHGHVNIFLDYYTILYILIYSKYRLQYTQHMYAYHGKNFLQVDWLAQQWQCE